MTDDLGGPSCAPLAFYPDRYILPLPLPPGAPRGRVREKSERWLELARLAVDEKDPDKLMEIVREIDRLLEEKLSRLRGDKHISGNSPPQSGADETL